MGHREIMNSFHISVAVYYFPRRGNCVAGVCGAGKSGSVRWSTATGNPVMDGLSGPANRCVRLTTLSRSYQRKLESPLKHYLSYTAGGILGCLSTGCLLKLQWRRTCAGCSSCSRRRTSIRWHRIHDQLPRRRYSPNKTGNQLDTEWFHDTPGRLLELEPIAGSESGLGSASIWVHSWF